MPQPSAAIKTIEISITTSDLKRAGKALYGARYQSDLGRLLGYPDSARIRKILRGERPIPETSAEIIISALRAKSAEAAKLARELSDR